MKKLSTSVSPFIMLVVPVLMVMLLSLSFNSTVPQDEDELTTSTFNKPLTHKIVKTSEASLIKFLMK